MINAQDDDFPEVLADPVQHSIRASARRPDAIEVISQRLANAVRVVKESGGHEVDDSGRYRLGQFLGDGTASWRGEDNLVGLLRHERSWRTASEPRTTSPRA